MCYFFTSTVKQCLCKTLIIIHVRKYFSNFVSVCRPVSLTLSLTICLCLCLCLCVYRPFTFPLCLCLCVCVSVCQTVCVCVYSCAVHCVCCNAKWTNVQFSRCHLYLDSGIACGKGLIPPAPTHPHAC